LNFYIVNIDILILYYWCILFLCLHW